MEAEYRPLPRFEYFVPSSLGEIVALLKEHHDGARLLAGGTDLLLNMKTRTVLPAVIIDLNRIAELSFMQVIGKNLHIGAMTRLNDVEGASIVREKIPLLAEAIRSLASRSIRNRATIGGNLCNASPAADSAPPLLALDASVKLQGPDGERIVALSDFFIGPGQSVRQADEVLTEVIVPCKQGSSAFVKLGRRKGFTLSIVSAAAFGMIRDGKFEDVRVALGAVAPTPMRSRKVEESLGGAQVKQEAIEKAAELVKEEVNPLTDVRASAAYRREMAAVVTKRVLERVAMGEEKC